jgi:hypothetical protein
LPRASAFATSINSATTPTASTASTRIGG